MSSSNATGKKLYEKLKGHFKVLRATLNPHLDVDALANNGVDVSFIDLLEERRGDYFLPMTMSRLESLDQRPAFDPCFSMEDPRWCYGYSLILIGELSDQLLKRHEETLFRGIEGTKWRQKGEKSSMERRLYEYGGGDRRDPTRQHDWTLSSVYKTESLPHEMCLSMHVVPNVRGPLRSEMMIILGLIGQRLKLRRFRHHEILPLLMLSVIGQDARIIQAHVCPTEQRLKVRYSQLFDFKNYTPTQRDLFIRWLMSDPITETKPVADEEKRSTTPAGTTAPQLKASETTSSRLSTQCGQELFSIAPRIPDASAVIVA